MAVKKANGEGSISRYKNGWRATLTLGRDTDGKLIRKQFYGKTKVETLDKMNEYKLKNNAGLLSSDDKITLSEWFYDWLFNFRINDLKPSSFERYEGIYRNYINNSPIGNIKLSTIRTSHIQSYYNSLLDSGKPPTTLKSLNKFLKACLTEAYKQNYIPRNYCNSIKLPKILKQEEVSVFSMDEQKALLMALERHRLKALFMMALGTGLRLGELLALKWSDIDCDSMQVNVERSVKRVTLISKEGLRETKIIEQTPKTESSTRTVPIPENIFNELEAHKKQQNEEIMKYRDIYNNDNYIFCTELGFCLDSRNLTRIYKRILTKANIPYKKFHSLRHTYATRLFEADVPIKTVQKLLGHGDMNTTMNIYTHVMDSVKLEAVDKINNLFVLESPSNIYSAVS